MGRISAVSHTYFFTLCKSIHFSLRISTDLICHGISKSISRNTNSETGRRTNCNNPTGTIKRESSILAALHRWCNKTKLQYHSLSASNILRSDRVVLRLCPTRRSFFRFPQFKSQHSTLKKYVSNTINSCFIYH